MQGYGGQTVQAWPGETDTQIETYETYGRDSSELPRIFSKLIFLCSDSGLDGSFSCEKKKDAA